MTTDGTSERTATNKGLIAGNEPLPVGAAFLRPPFDDCPSCNYSLEGLPAAHRCPECGFPYDEHTLAWVEPLPWRPMLIAVAVVAVVAFLCGFVFHLPGGYVSLMLFGLGVPSVILAPLLLLRKPMVAITPEGVIVRSILRIEQTFPWHEVMSLEVRIPPKHRGINRMWLITSMGKHPLHVVFDHEADMRRFEECLWKAKEHYLSRQQGASL